MTTRRLLYLLPIFALPFTASAQSAPAGDSVQMQMKCGVNQDRVWVYDSLTDLNIEAKLKCGDAVQIVSRVKGYVKIHSANGTEGYVPDSVFPDLPPLPPSPDDSVAGSALAMAASHAAAMRNSAAKSEAVAAAPSPVSAAAPVSVAPSPASSVAANVAPSPAPVSTAAATSVAASEATPAKPAITPSLSQPVAKRSTAVRPAEAPALIAASAQPTIATAPSASVAPPAIPAAAPAVSARAPAMSAASAPAPSPTLEASTAAPVVTTQPVQIAPPPAPPAKKVKRDAAASTRAAAIAPAPAITSAPALTEAKMDVNPAVVLQQPKMKPALVESEDYPDAEPDNESADPACHIYFSAYGLSPSQFKWLAANRKKEYPSVCPAPNVASVDFVILFTHDSDTYTGAMPEPVHTDRSGFSDFNPLTTVDSALVSGSDADKAHHEYVWVFQMKRGAFDPAKFSPRRRPQFTTVESKGSARALEDAFGYVQEQGATQIAANQ